MGGDLSERYRTAMRPHRAFGYALYEPVPYARLFPGVLGYLDEKRQWHPLLDLTKRSIFNIVRGEAVEPETYTSFLIPVGKTPDSRFWGPRVSSKHSETEVKLEAEADALALGLQATVGGAIEYQSRVDFGAILMCDDAVVAEGFDVRDPFLAWIKKNSAALLAEFPDLQKHGIYIPTWTYSAAETHINAWEGVEHKIVLGFQVGATGVGNVGPGTSWSRGRASNGWSHYLDGKRVVFFSGVKVKYGMFGPREEVEKKWRGQPSDKFLVHRLSDEDDGELESSLAEMEVLGDDYDVAMKRNGY
ncbi:hypothetical protein BKA56DRAFT_620646 [Ilyonectria sp. MPI-CAGE-AT-0026]|nr:hypothetical protein BKA56DRAFT_620646 [Ilyonectria sp. MPI-CAGE-AT-0026]